MGIGDESNVIGEAVSVGREDTWATKTGAGGAMGEESTSTTGALATRLLGVSGMVGEGVQVGDESAGWA